MIEYKISGGKLTLPGGVRKSFQLPIAEIIAFEDFVVLRLAPQGSDRENIYAIDAVGDLMWRITDKASQYMRGSYLGINRTETGMIYAIHDSGITYTIEPRTGSIMDQVLAK